MVAKLSVAIDIIAEFLEPSLWVVLVYAKKKRKGDSGVK